MARSISSIGIGGIVGAIVAFGIWLFIGYGLGVAPILLAFSLYPQAPDNPIVWTLLAYVVVHILTPAFAVLMGALVGKEWARGSGGDTRGHGLGG